MKNFKIIITLLFSAFLFSNCEVDGIEPNNNNFKSEEFDELINLSSKYYENKKNMIIAFENFVIDENKKNKSSNIELDKIIINVNFSDDEVLYKKEDLPNFYSKKQKDFLLNYFNKIANVNDDELLEEIYFYKKLLTTKSFEDQEYRQIYPILDVAEKIVISSTSKLLKENNLSKRRGGVDYFLSCMKGKGNSIGRGLVEGAVTGLISGSTYGAAGGTVALPGVGSVTGAVAGGIFGMAGGAVTGAIGATAWATMDCMKSSAIKTKCNLVIGYPKKLGMLMVKTI